MNRKWMLGIAAALLCGCGAKYWNPTPEQMADAEKLAKFCVLQKICDQVGSPVATGVKLDAAGLPQEYPIAFTVGGTLYSRLRMKFSGEIRAGDHLVHVLYFDPGKVPDWDANPRAAPGFAVTVDLDKRTADREGGR